MADELIQQDPNLENPYTTDQGEQAEVNDYRGRFAHQIPTTDFFTKNGSNVKPYQNEVSVDTEGFLGFWNVNPDGTATFVSKSKLILNQVQNIVNSGILERVIGINNNMEFYHAYRAGTNVYPNSSLAFPNGYNYFSIHAMNTTDSLLVSDMSVPVKTAVNGKLSTKQLDPTDPNSFRVLPNFIVNNSDVLSNGSTVTVKFYSNNGANEPVIAEKVMEIRVSSNSSTAASEALPLYLRLSGVSNGVVKMKADGSYDLVIPSSLATTQVRFYGVVYYSVPNSNTAQYYSRNLEYEGTIEDGQEITVKYKENDTLSVSVKVNVHVIPNPTLTKVFVTSWFNGTAFTSENTITCDYRVFGTIDNDPGLYDITGAVNVVPANSQYNISQFDSKTKTYVIPKRTQADGEPYVNLTVSSTAWNVADTDRSYVHIPTNTEIQSNEVSSVHIKRVCNTGTTDNDFVDFLSVGVDNNAGSIVVKLRYGGLQGGITEEQLVRIINGGDDVTGGIPTFCMTFWKASTPQTTQSVFISSDLTAGNFNTADGRITFNSLASGSLNDFKNIINSTTDVNSNLLCTFRVKSKQGDQSVYYVKRLSQI